MREGVDAVDDDEVVAGQQAEQGTVVRLAIGEMEVAQDRDLVQRPAPGGLGGDGGDPGRVGVRSGDLDTDTGDR